MESKEKCVLVSPLNWGLGHATRCIPLIKELLNQNVKVVIGADGNCLIKLEQEFPHLPFLNIPGINIGYNKNLPMSLSMMFQVRSIINDIKKENVVLRGLINKHKITHIISDNRYGIYSDKVPSAFITHQLNIKGGKYLSWIEPLLLKINKSYISKFNELWIPDQPPVNNLSGSLTNTDNLDKEVKYLGYLSRFTGHAYKVESKIYHTIALLSGPEPQRTLLENKVLYYFKTLDVPCLLIRGKPEHIDNFTTTGNITTVDSISDKMLVAVLNPESTLICRSGYSTLMDIVALNHRKVLLIPTPGQTEQEYLANRMRTKFNCRVQSQNSSFHSDEDGIICDLPTLNDDDFLKQTINSFLSK